MESLPSLSVTTKGALVIPPTPKIAEFGWLMIDGKSEDGSKLSGIRNRES